jgi:hypothetical protein
MHKSLIITHQQGTSQHDSTHKLLVQSGTTEEFTSLCRKTVLDLALQIMHLGWFQTRACRSGT